MCTVWGRANVNFPPTCNWSSIIYWKGLYCKAIFVFNWAIFLSPNTVYGCVSGGRSILLVYLPILVQIPYCLSHYRIIMWSSGINSSSFLFSFYITLTILGSLHFYIKSSICLSVYTHTLKTHQLGFWLSLYLYIYDI